MTIARRTFLGSLIALVGSHSFLARLAHEPVQAVAPIKYPYRMLYRDSISGYTIQAPPIASIEKEGASILFESARMDIVKQMQLDQLILLNNKNEVITRANFYSGSVHMIPGDSLSVNYKIDIRGLNLFSIDESIALFQESQRLKRDLHIDEARKIINQLQRKDY